MATADARSGWCSAASSSGWYRRVAQRITHGSVCACSLSSSEASTGTSVSDSSSETPRANTMVSATGTNSLPSNPCSVSRGMKVRQMMRMPEATGTATSRAAANMRCRRGWCALGACGSSRLTAFSTTTTAASTSMPMAIARPPKLIKLALMPTRRISKKVPSAASGSITATTSAARSSPRNRSSRMTTSTVASSKALSTVPTARSISVLRS